jgi:uroporphyrinogen decarboxylase
MNIRPKDRMINALKLGLPLDYIPHLEFKFEVPEEAIGRKFHHLDWFATEDTLDQYENALLGIDGGSSYKYSNGYLKITSKEKDYKLKEDALTYVKIAEKYDWAGIRVHFGAWNNSFLEDEVTVIKEIKKITGERFYLQACMNFGTMHIPSGKNLLRIVYELKDNPKEMKLRLNKIMKISLERAKKFINAGVDGIDEIADYAFNTGLLLSPKDFNEFVTPYLNEISETIRKQGIYFVKHTDGDVSVVLDDIINCKPNGIQSLEIVGEMDRDEIREKTLGKVCIIGNVNSSILVTGKKEEIEDEVKEAIKKFSPGGGFVLSSSNCIFRGIPIKNYQFMINKWLELRSLLG